MTTHEKLGAIHQVYTVAKTLVENEEEHIPFAILYATDKGFGFASLLPDEFAREALQHFIDLVRKSEPFTMMHP